MRVIHVLGGLDPRFGGPSVAALGTAIGARLAGAQNLIVVPASTDERWTEDVAEILSERGVGLAVFPHSRIFPSRARRWGISGALARWLLVNTRRCDLVHVHGAWTFAALIALLASKLTGRPAVLSTHASMMEFDVAKSGLLGRLAKRVLRRLYLVGFDLVIVASELELVDTRCQRARVAVIPHALLQRPTRSDRRVQRQCLRIGYIGRFDPTKNVDVVIQAVAGVPEVHLEIGGTGPKPITRDLRDLVERVGIRDRVVWRGWVEASAKSAFFAGVDVVLMPSEYESFGMAAAEAICAGVPAIVSTTTGLAPLVAKYRAGMVVAPNVTELRLALESLVSDEGLLEELRRGAAVAGGEFSPELHGARLWKEYIRLTRERLPLEVARGFQ